MSSKTEINGTFYNIKKGKTLINNTTYSILNGRSLVNSTSNIINFVVPMPEKGQLITMSLGGWSPISGVSNLYRVLKVNDTVAEVMAMYEIDEINFSSNSNTLYSSSTLKQTLNTYFYNSLSSSAKSAIVRKDINQYSYDYGGYSDTHDSDVKYSTKKRVATITGQYIYALDCEDIEIYFGGTDTQQGSFTTNQIRDFFWNSTASQSEPEMFWFRSSCSASKYADNVWMFTGMGNMAYPSININPATKYDYGARPAFQIDLSKMSWTPYN